MLSRSDTSFDAHRFQTAFLKSLTGHQRVAIAVEMTLSAHEISKYGIASRHPEYSSDEVQQAFVRMLLGDELFSAANPGVPLLAP